MLAPDNIILNFAPPAAEALKALIDQVRSRVPLAVAPGVFEKEELHLLHGYLGEGLAILHNLTDAVDQALLVLAISPAGVGTRRPAPGPPWRCSAPP